MSTFGAAETVMSSAESVSDVAPEVKEPDIGRSSPLTNAPTVAVA